VPEERAVKPIRILLADDHPLVRAGLRSLLEGLPGIEVAAEARDGWEAVRLIEAQPPDVVLLDLMMPGLNGLEVLARVSGRFPSVRVVILSVEAGKQFVLQALRSGAAGYLLKSCAPAELELAVRAAARGELYLHSGVSRHAVGDNLPGPQPANSLDRLTPRQREVLHLVAAGHSTKGIARELRLSPKTVEMYRRQLMKALDIYDVAGLVRYAIRMGVISTDA
jgi:DNA-binding NarL/FixJ family response regulator